MAKEKLTDAELRSNRFYVKVHSLLAEGADRENPIPVNDLGDHAHGRAVVYPNKKGVLSQCQINILNDSVERMEVNIPPDSGIYEASNPKKMAEKHYPGFTAIIDRITGQLKVIKIKPRYAVEVIGPVEDKAKIAAEEEAAKKAEALAEAQELIDKAAADRAIADKVIADKAIADKAIADKAIADKAIADKAIADKAAADKAAADKAIADKAIADKAAADKAAADKAAADKAAVKEAPKAETKK